MEQRYKVFSIACMFIVAVSAASYVGYERSNVLEEKLSYDDNRYIQSPENDDNPCHVGGLINKECAIILNGR